MMTKKKRYRFFFVNSTLKILRSVSCLRCRVLRRRNIKSICCNKCFSFPFFYFYFISKIIKHYSFEYGISERKFAGKCYIAKLAVMKRKLKY